MTRILLALVALCVLLHPLGERAPAPPIRVVVDTDAGSDDLIALAFLLSRTDVRIEAVTVVNGLAHIERGARNLARLLAYAGHPEIPIFTGRPAPLAGRAAFPAAWRRQADTAAALPPASSPAIVPRPGAARFLATRLRDPASPVHMVALGPLTNLADALGDLGPHAVPALQRLLVMGGAIAVHGNVGRAIPGGNDSAEWNVFVDPLAARRVLRSGIGLTLVPLDATNHVPIDRPFLDAYSARVPTRLGAVVAHVFDEARGNMAAGAYYAWDPLACVGLVDSQVLSVRPAVLDVALTGAQRGVTFVRPGAPAGVTIAFDADAARFRQVFIEALTTPARRPGPE